MARKRVVLNLKTAREIESLAPTFADRMRRGGKSQLSYALAERFGVDAKTIRDIWNRKSWGEGGRKKGVTSTTAETKLVDVSEINNVSVTTATTTTTTTTATTINAMKSSSSTYPFSQPQQQNTSEDMGIFIIADSFLRDTES